MQAPRFFVETDEVVLSANVHNYLADSAKDSDRVVLETRRGDTLQLMEQATAVVRVETPAGGEARVDWRVKVTEARAWPLVRMKAITDEESDAMEMKFPGPTSTARSRTESWAGTIRPDGPAVQAGDRPSPPSAASSICPVLEDPLLAHPGGSDGRCPALPGRVTRIRLHRARR